MAVPTPAYYRIGSTSVTALPNRPRRGTWEIRSEHASILGHVVRRTDGFHITIFGSTVEAIAPSLEAAANYLSDFHTTRANEAAARREAAA